MKPGIPVPRRVGPSFVSLLLSTGLLLPALSYAPPLYAAEPTQTQSSPAGPAVLHVTVTDAVNGQTLDGVKIALYWADTEANRAAGRLPGKLVTEGAVISSNEQTGLASGRYDRVLPVEADYYFTAEKSGYLPFDSRNPSGDNQAAADVLRSGITPTDYRIALIPVAHKYPAYMNGYTDGKFRPEQNITRAELAAILQRSMGKSYTAENVEFHDIDPAKWSASSVVIVASHGWMQGTGGEKFEPNRQASRAELARILVNVFGWNDKAGSNTFKDTAGHWAAEAIAVAAAHGAMSGYPDGTFRPDQPVTRAEIAVMMNRLISRPADSGLPMTWSDVPPSHWAYGDIMAASLDHTPSSVR